MSNLIEFFFNSVIGIAVLAIFCRMIFNLYKTHKQSKVDKCNCPGCLISNDPLSGYQPCHNLNMHIKPLAPWPRK